MRAGEGGGRGDRNGEGEERFHVWNFSLFCCHTGPGDLLNIQYYNESNFYHNVIECMYLMFSLTNKPIEIPDAILFSILF